jgi:hypothetical protein
MDLEHLSKKRRRVGKAGMIVCLVALLAVLDGLVGQFREPPNIVRLLPGMAVEIDGGLTAEVKGIQDLNFTSSSEYIRVSFDAVHKGYYLGGEMWRGQLTVSPQIQPGEYSLTVSPKKAAAAKDAPAFRVLIFPDAASLQQTQKSLVRRYLGLSPFALAAYCLPAILLAFGLVYYLSGEREGLLARAGQAEIYRVLRREGGYEIRFGLGTAQGLGPGSSVNIINDLGQVVGTAQVEESTLTTSVAVVTGDREVKEGYLISGRGV